MLAPEVHNRRKADSIILGKPELGHEPLGFHLFTLPLPLALTLSLSVKRVIWTESIRACLESTVKSRAVGLKMLEMERGTIWHKKGLEDFTLLFQSRLKFQRTWPRYQLSLISRWQVRTFFLKVSLTISHMHMSTWPQRWFCPKFKLQASWLEPLDKTEPFNVQIRKMDPTQVENCDQLLP